MKWMMRFKSARPAEIRAGREASPEKDRGCVAVLVDCEEGDLQGEVEARAMELEKSTGRTWVCAGIVKMIRRGGEAL